MSTNIVREIAAEAARLPVEQQQQILGIVKSFAAGKSLSPRRSVFGDLEHLGVRVADDDIEQARREMWRGYMDGDE